MGLYITDRFTGLKVHNTVTEDRVFEACERRRMSLDNPGFCIECGHENGGCEPDLRGARCESCGTYHAVYGCEDLLMRCVA